MIHFIVLFISLTSVLIDPATNPAVSPEDQQRANELRWLREPGVRLVRTSQPWTSPAAGAGRLRRWLASSDSARRNADPFADRRRLRVAHRPTRAL